MKFFVVAFAFIATAAAAGVSTEYLPPVQEVSSLPTQKYLPPVSSVSFAAPEEQTVLADDGYRYKTVKKYRLRHRRDVNELPTSEYLPPVQAAGLPTQEYLPPVSSVSFAAPEQQTVLADDGYRYKTVKRFRLRHRRDVNELPTNEYLPPVQAAPLPTQEYLAPVSVAAPEVQTVLADDGYRYKTVKKYRLRHRRDVNELPTSEYLPPVQAAGLPTQEYLPPVSSVSFAAPEQQTVLADDGYRYKTVKRFRLRHRRDVNELPTNEYLPPVQAAPLPTQEYLAPVSVAAPEVQTVLADDGYRYKTVKKYRLRHRRDVNELPTSEYLPPVQAAGLPTQEYLPPVSSVSFAAPEQQTVLADDGYRYKTVRRLRLRHRRDVNELPTSEYLPPVQAAPLPTQEYLAPVSVAAPEVQTVLADDGYRYKTVKKYRLRHRRDVNELPTSEYLPPVQAAGLPTQEYLPPVSSVSFAAPEQQTVLADDGYRYKTVKRFRLRHRRDVNELPTNEYLPPVQAAPLPTQEYLAPVSVAAPEVQTVLADDGYRYKTVKKYRLRHRRDVNELPTSEYLPPVQAAGLPTQEYLPPVSSVSFAAPEQQTVLADDGYRYKTVRRLRLRHRRDVSEIPSNDYLPPVAQDLNISLAPELSTVLSNDGYRYKTVKKYRLRRH